MLNTWLNCPESCDYCRPPHTSLSAQCTTHAWVKALTQVLLKPSALWKHLDLPQKQAHIPKDIKAEAVFQSYLICWNASILKQFSLPRNEELPVIADELLPECRQLETRTHTSTRHCSMWSRPTLSWPRNGCKKADRLLKILAHCPRLLPWLLYVHSKKKHHEQVIFKGLHWGSSPNQ